MRLPPILLGAVPLLLAVANSACSPLGRSASNKEPEPDQRICQPVPPQNKGQWGACIHLMAYKYAHAPDPAETVAKAVATACGYRVAEAINASPPDERLELAEAITGTDKHLALQKVVEARAGRCGVPK